jgi:nucleoside-diphosphate-sugar epimerase
MSPTSSAPVTTAPVLVTGAGGFIASRIVEQLLARGYRVRGTMRSLKKERELAALRGLPGAAERLELVEADLNSPGAFDQPVRACEYVMHTASPYSLHVADPQRDLVDPAVNGTASVLAACQRAASVRRVVLTSSMAAITDEPDGSRVLTERDWNVKSSLQRNPYYYSKTVAERAAWQFIEREKPPFDLVAINPFLVIGPSLVPSLNTSNEIFVDLLNGRFPGIVGLTWGLVDVRDVAEAHPRAMETPAAHGRYICAGDCASMRRVVDLLKRNGWKDKLPSISLDNAIGNVIVQLASFAQPKGIGSYLRSHIGRVPRYDTSKIRGELGMQFRPVDASILDTMADLKRWGHIAA